MRTLTLSTIHQPLSTSKSSRQVVKRFRSKDFSRIRLLHQHHDFELGGIPIGVRCDVSVGFKLPVGNCSQFTQLPHHGGVMQRAPAVFASPYGTLTVRPR